jgi:DNA replication protein DnaC
VIKAPTEICPLCAGTGWKAVDGLATGSGKTERRVTRCDCRQRARAESLLTSARIPRRYEHCELANYDTDFPGAHRSLAEAHFIAANFAEKCDPHGDKGLLIIGKIGTGKTHLAVGVMKELILKRGIPCLFYDYRELLKEIQNSYNTTVQTTELDVLRPVFETDVLVLDELGAVKPTEWVWDTVSLILNTRYNDNRITIITTKARFRPHVPRLARKPSATASANACARACMKCAASSRSTVPTSARNSGAPVSSNLLRHGSTRFTRIRLPPSSSVLLSGEPTTW